MVLLCVPCGALYRPIEFIPIYEEDDDDDGEEDDGKKQLNETQESEDSEAQKLLQNGSTHLYGSRKKLPTGHAEPIPEEERSSDDDDDDQKEENDKVKVDILVAASNPTLERFHHGDRIRQSTRSHEEGDNLTPVRHFLLKNYKLNSELILDEQPFTEWKWNWKHAFGNFASFDQVWRGASGRRQKIANVSATIPLTWRASASYGKHNPDCHVEIQPKLESFHVDGHVAESKND